MTARPARPIWDRADASIDAKMIWGWWEISSGGCGNGEREFGFEGRFDGRRTRRGSEGVMLLLATTRGHSMLQRTCVVFWDETVPFVRLDIL